MRTIVQRQELVAAEDALHFQQQTFAQQEQLRQLQAAAGLDKEKEKQAAQQHEPHVSSDKGTILSVSITFTPEQLAAYIDALVGGMTDVLEAEAKTPEEKKAVAGVAQAINRAAKRPASTQTEAVAETDHTADEKEMVQALESARGVPMTTSARRAVVGEARRMHRDARDALHTFIPEPVVRQGAETLLARPPVARMATAVFGLVSFYHQAQQGVVRDPNPHTAFGGSVSATPTPAPRPSMSPSGPAPHGRKRINNNKDNEQSNPFGSKRIDLFASNYLNHFGMSPVMAQLEHAADLAFRTGFGY